MKEPIISQKMEKEFTKTFKETFLEFISTFEDYFLGYGFIRKRDGYFVRTQKDYDEFFFIDGSSDSYLYYIIYIGVHFKKFDNLLKKALGLTFKQKETNYLCIGWDGNFRNFEGFKPCFHCGEAEDYVKATETIKFTFENIAPEFYKQNSSLISIRDYVFAVDISTSDYVLTKFQLPNGNAMGLVFFITYLYDYNNIQTVLDHYKKMFEGRIVYQEFEDFYVNKIFSVNREEALKKLVR